jgi:putative tryptophan/tyrosine transport system substrate-binding protein
MKRHEFVTLLGGAVAAWPLAARAQQSGRMRRIGVLTGFAENDPEAQRRIAAFMQGLAELGWSNGRNVRVDFRWGSANPDLIRGYAEEMVRLQPDVMLVNSSSVLKFVQQITHSIPIVFVQVNDPVGTGLVASLAHPGDNVTGFTPAEFSLGGKQLETLKEIAPEVSRVAVMTDLGSPPLIGMQRSIEIAAATLGVRVVTAAVHDAGEIERATESFAREANGGLIVLANPISNVHRALIIELAAKHRLPADRLVDAGNRCVERDIDIPTGRARALCSVPHHRKRGGQFASRSLAQPCQRL